MVLWCKERMRAPAGLRQPVLSGECHIVVRVLGYFLSGVCMTVHTHTTQNVSTYRISLKITTNMGCIATIQFSSSFLMLNTSYYRKEWEGLAS